MREYLFYISILIYGLFSSPTPDSLDWPEYAVMACLIASLFHPSTITKFTQSTLPSSLGFHRLFISYMMTIPLIVGLLYGHDTASVIRDYVPLLLLGLPLIYPQLIQHHKFEMALMSVGVFFSLRFLIDYFTFNLDGMLYLANSPLVLFSTLMGMHWLTSTHPQHAIIKRLSGLLIFIICMSAMLFMEQRAPFIMTVLATIFIIIYRAIRSPIKIAFIISILCFIALSTLPIYWEGLLSLADKLITVGDNNRLAEIQAALSNSSFWGHGWGFEWQSPAVGDYWVRYTHAMPTYYYLKAGMIGMVLSLIFICLWMEHAFKICIKNLGMGLAIFIPLTIHFFLYTGYKTYDISLLLTFLVLCNCPRTRAHHPS